MSEKTARKSKLIKWIVWSLVAMLVVGALMTVIPFWIGFAAMNQLSDRDEIIFDYREVLASAPEWTPDGSRIVFGHEGGIYAVNRDGSALNRIHGSDGEDYQSSVPRVSPDGAGIVYSRYQKNRNHWITMTSALAGSGERTLTKSVSDSQFGTRGRHQSGHAWSPDGSRIAFFNDFHLYAIGAGGADLIRLAELSSGGSFSNPLVWSPDGNPIAFAGSGSALHVIETDGSGATELVKEESGSGIIISSPTWSPDGNRIAFVRTLPPDEDGRYSWQVVTLSGPDLNTAHQVADGFYKYSGDYELAWSPDGENLLISGYNFVSVVNADGSDFRTLVNLQPRYPGHIRASWSPDGSKIAMYNGGGYEGALFVMSSDGSDKRVLVLNGNPPRPAQNQAWDSAHDAPTPTP